MREIVRERAGPRLLSEGGAEIPPGSQVALLGEYIFASYCLSVPSFVALVGISNFTVRAGPFGVARGDRVGVARGDRVSLDL